MLPAAEGFELDGLMRIPGNANPAELQLGAVASQTAWEAGGKALLFQDTGINQVALNLVLPLNKIFIQPRKKCGSWKDGRLHHFILLPAELPLPC